MKYQDKSRHQDHLKNQEKSRQIKTSRLSAHPDMLGA